MVRHVVLVHAFEGSSPSIPAKFISFPREVKLETDMNGELKIISGSSNLALSEAICDHLGSKLTPCLREKFSDGEIRIEIQDNVRGCDVFIVQSTCDPVNFHFMELCLMLDALKRASARRVTAVVPYYGYARQDRKVSPRAPISAKLCADCLNRCRYAASGHHRPARRADSRFLQSPGRQYLCSSGSSGRTAHP